MLLPSNFINIFLAYSYSKEDEKIKKVIDTHLSSLEHLGMQIICNHSSSQEKRHENYFDNTDQDNLKKADVIILLVSSDFLSKKELKNSCINLAVRRYKDEDTIFLPLILDHCHWQTTKLENFKVFPSNHETISHFRNRKLACFEFSQVIQQSVEELKIYRNNLKKFEEKISEMLIQTDNINSLNQDIKILQEQLNIKEKDVKKIIKNLYKPEKKANYEIQHNEDKKKFISIQKIAISIVSFITIGLFLGFCKPQFSPDTQRQDSLDDTLDYQQIIQDYFFYVTNKAQRKKAWEMLDPQGYIRVDFSKKSFKNYDKWWDQNVNKVELLEILDNERNLSQFSVNWRYCDKKTQKFIFIREKWLLKQIGEETNWIVDPQPVEKRPSQEKC